MAKETSGARARITVKVQPRARATRVAGRMENAYRLQLAAPPVDGKASEACVAYVAELAGVAKSRVRIVSGATGRMKVVEIEGDRAGGDGAEAGSGSAGGVSWRV